MRGIAQRWLAERRIGLDRFEGLVSRGQTLLEECLGAGIQFRQAIEHGILAGIQFIEQDVLIHVVGNHGGLVTVAEDIDSIGFRNRIGERYSS